MNSTLPNYSPFEFLTATREIGEVLFSEPSNFLSKLPRGLLLGGQPASGKTALIKYIRQTEAPTDFVVINGDEFRNYHPNYRAIYSQYGTEAPHYTQPFSNAMVEWAKKECLTKGYNFIVEGTMRNFSVIQNTVAELQAHGFSAELHVLAVPHIESLLGIFDRYERDITLTGMGRFSAIAVHDEAYHNIPANLNRASRELTVDRVVVYRRDLVNELATFIDTADMTNLDTVDFDRLFDQVRQPQRDAAFYKVKFDALLQSAVDRGENDPKYFLDLSSVLNELD